MPPRKPSSIILTKVQRLRQGARPRFMDLFAGCGGLSLGFLSAGFTPIATVEHDPLAAETHKANFVLSDPEAESSSCHRARDVTEEDPETIFNDLGLLGSVDDQIDVLVGGPPCQAFARVGRAKLRHEARRQDVTEPDRAFLVDGRVNLWHRYIHYVRQTKPIALLMENVPDMLNHGGTNVADLVARSLQEHDYNVSYTLLNAAWYGVPQTRERMFLVGIHKALASAPRFPVPTHHVVLPSGYEGTRAAALKHVARNGEHFYRWIKDPQIDDCLPKVTSAGEALADLPPIFAIEELEAGTLRRGRKNPAEPCRYINKRFGSDYSHLMRCWPGFESGTHTSGHVIRFLPRDYKFFKIMEEGWQYPDIWTFVENKRKQMEATHKELGLIIDRRTSSGKEFYRNWTLPYDPNKFPNKWWKLHRDRPVRTLMAHLGKDSYSHIHFDSEQARTISVREAARLQSFPDGFVFKGSMNPAFRQIGNAVPPLLAYAIAMAIRESIGCLPTHDFRVDLLNLNPSSICTTEGDL